MFPATEIMQLKLHVCALCKQTAYFRNTRAIPQLKIMLCRTALGNYSWKLHGCLHCIRSVSINSKLLISLSIITYDPTNLQLTHYMCAISASSSKQLLHNLNLTFDPALFFTHVCLMKSFTFYFQNFPKFYPKIKHWLDGWSQKLHYTSSLRDVTSCWLENLHLL